MYDSLEYVKKLEATGIPRLQAEAQVEIMSDFVESKFATKQDLKDQTAELRREMSEIKAELKLEIKDATLTYGKMLVVAVGVIITAVGLMIKL